MGGAGRGCRVTGGACSLACVKRILASLVLGLVALLGLSAATVAVAEGDTPSSWQITAYEVGATVDTSGTTAVRIDLAFDFSNDPGHGPYVTLPLRQRVADPDLWRMLDVTVGEVSSSTGANADVLAKVQDGNLLIRIGNENRTYTGVQQYTINYTIRGLIAPNQASSGLDEFNWNAVGDGWEVPLNNVAVTVTGPVDVSRVACWTGDGYSSPCDEAAPDGRSAHFSESYLSPGTPLQVVAGFPAGTFTGAEARFEKRYHIGNMFPVTPLTAGLTAALSALGLAALLRRTRRGARDEVYLGMTPGVIPTRGQPVNVGRGVVDAPVAVAFTPPPGAHPGELGVLTDSTANNVDITATLIDLAVRGYLRIDQHGKKDWTFVQLQGTDKLADYEAHLLSSLFAQGSEVTMDDLKNKSYATVLSGTRQRLYHRVTGELKWFTRSPALVRGLAVAAGIALVALGVGLGLLLGLIGFGLLGLAFVIVGAGVLVANNRFGARTATGSAVLAQTKGFELYLTTAEADQIRFEEGIDVFSRYLPYAIVFGVAERWTKIFAELAAQGRYQPTTSWYQGYTYGSMLSPDFANSLDRLASQMSSSMQAATAASSGGSGFSGGGGFGGGGGGGW